MNKFLKITYSILALTGFVVIFTYCLLAPLYIYRTINNANLTFLIISYFLIIFGLVEIIRIQNKEYQ